MPLHQAIQAPERDTINVNPLELNFRVLLLDSTLIEIPVRHCGNNERDVGMKASVRKADLIFSLVVSISSPVFDRNGDVMKSREAWQLGSHVSKSDGTLARMWLAIGDKQIPTAVIRFVRSLCCMPLERARAPEVSPFGK